MASSNGNGNSSNPQITIAIIGFAGVVTAALITGFFAFLPRLLDQQAMPTATPMIVPATQAIATELPTSNEEEAALTPTQETPPTESPTESPRSQFEIPDFVLLDAQQNTVSLHDNLQDRHVVLAFYYAYS
jgi:hypothetical protein